MAALPWFKFHSAAPTNIKVAALRRRIGPEADAYLYRLWAYCARDMPSGRFESEAADGLEMAIGWHGEPGALVAALVAVRLLDAEGATLVVHDWEREQGAHVAKFLKDAKRPHSKSRPPSSREVPARELGDSREVPAQTPRGVSPISTLSSSKGVQGESAPGSLMDRLAAAFAAARGQPYQPTRSEEEALRVVLSLARGDEDEVVRRWSIGLAWRGYPGCSSLQELKQERCWGRFTAPQPEAQSFQKPASKGFSTIQYREGAGNDFE